MKEIYRNIEQRGFVWQCANDSLKSRKYRSLNHSQGTKEPCGNWNPYWGRKWHEVKESPRWVGKCDKCGRRKQLNRGKVFPERTWLESKEAAEAEAKRRNALPDSEWVGWEEVEGDA